MVDISRNPEDYYLTIHAGQQRKHRGIAWSEVRDTIKNGTVKNTHKSDRYLLVHEPAYADEPIGVVVAPSDGAVVTVEYRQ